MSSALHFRALDDRGEAILNKLDVKLGTGSERGEDRERAYFVAVIGDADLDPDLKAIDPDWSEHVKSIDRR